MNSFEFSTLLFAGEDNIQHSEEFILLIVQIVLKLFAFSVRTQILQEKESVLAMIFPLTFD